MESRQTHPGLRHQRAVLSVEKEIIRRNIADYDGLLQMISRAGQDAGNPGMLAGIEDLARIQLGKIRKYPFIGDAAPGV